MDKEMGTMLCRGQGLGFFLYRWGGITGGRGDVATVDKKWELRCYVVCRAQGHRDSVSRLLLAMAWVSILRIISRIPKSLRPFHLVWLLGFLNSSLSRSLRKHSQIRTFSNRLRV